MNIEKRIEEKMNQPSNIHWLSNPNYAKAVGQFKLQLNGVLEPFRLYGLDVFIPGAIEEITCLAEDFGLRVRGVDKPIDIKMVRNNRKVTSWPLRMSQYPGVTALQSVSGVQNR